MGRGRRKTRQSAIRTTETTPGVQFANNSMRSEDHMINSKLSTEGRPAQPNDSVYQYGQLQSTDAIRIISLRAGKSTDPLVISLELALLDRLPEIQALSYVWGNTTRTHMITCNKKPLGITSNLKYALRALRSPDQTTLLWVDAICIDQEDPQERNHQIKHMSRIYSEAKNVLVWLGPDPEKSGHAAFDFAQQLATDEVYKEDVLRNWWANRSKIDSLRELSSRDWFHRMWTMQEIGLASSAIVLCGQSRIDWNTLYSAYDLFNNRLTFNNLRCLGFQPDKVVLLYRWITAGKKRSFLELLEISQSRGATDPRDRVFALMSHPSAQKVSKKDKSVITFLIEPDYTKTTNAVYVAVAEQLMKENQNLNVLSYVRDGREVPAGLPTWAPAWHILPTSNCLLDSKQNFCASGVAPQHIFSHCVPKVCQNKHIPWARVPDFNGQLEIGSLDIGKIAWCSKPANSVELLALASNSRIKEVWKIVRQRFRSSPGVQLLKIFSDVSTCGLLHPKYRVDNARQIYLHELSAYWRYIWANEPEAELIPRLGSSNISPKQFASATWYAWKGRVLFYTHNGYLGLGPASLKTGDDVCILEGGKVPFVLRENMYNQWAVIGECYVSGVMRGEKAQVGHYIKKLV